MGEVRLTMLMKSPFETPRKGSAMTEAERKRGRSMTDTVVASDGSNRLPILAAEINDMHQKAVHHAGAAVFYGQSAVESAIKAGGLLLEAKKTVAHGQWLPWLRANITFSERTAQAYMRVARRGDEIRSTADLSLGKALDLVAGPSRITADDELTAWLEHARIRRAQRPADVHGTHVLPQIASENSGKCGIASGGATTTLQGVARSAGTTPPAARAPRK